MDGGWVVPFRCGHPLSCGVDGEPLQLRLQGLTLPTIPAGVGRPPLHCTVYFGGAIAIVHGNDTIFPW